jgi:hypothetical protein
LKAWPSAENWPVSDRDAPIVIGPVELLVGLLVLLALFGLLPLVQAASTPTPRSTTALAANLVGLTPWLYLAKQPHAG